MASPSRFQSSRTAFEPDPYPYSLLAYRSFPNGMMRTYGFVFATALKYRMTQQNQRATRFSTGDRKFADMSLMNVHSWRDLHRGGTGAKTAGDATRYRYSRGLFAGDADEIKLAPKLEEVAWNQWINGTLGVSEQVVNLHYSQQSGNQIIVVTSDPSAARSRFWSIHSQRTVPELITFTWPASGNLNQLPGTVWSSTLWKNVFYVTNQVSAGLWHIRKLELAGGVWAGNEWQTNANAHIVYNDGQWLYKGSFNGVQRHPGGDVTKDWQGPVFMQDSSQITAMQSYGDANETAVYVATEAGLYRMLEEAVPNSTVNLKTIKRAYPVEIQPGASDRYSGLHLTIARGELVWNYPKGLLRHTIGSTEYTSPFEDNGHPAAYRGTFGPIQDGIGGTLIACNPVDGENVGPPVIFRWQEGRWHEFITLPANAKYVSCMEWSPRLYNGYNTLWVTWMCNDQFSRMGYVLWPRTAIRYNDVSSTIRVEETGTIVFPRWTGEFPELDKAISEVVCEIEPNHPPGMGGVKFVITQDDHGTGKGGQSREIGYSSVPILSDMAETTWVPDEAKIEMTGKAFNCSLTIDRKPGGSYTDAQMRVTDHWLLEGKGLFCCGFVTDRTTAGVAVVSHNVGIKWWWRRAWRRFQVRADSCVLITDFVNNSESFVLCFGAFFNDAGNVYGGMRYDYVEDAAVFFQPLKGRQVVRAAQGVNQWMVVLDNGQVGRYDGGTFWFNGTIGYDDPGIELIGLGAERWFLAGKNIRLNGSGSYDFIWFELDAAGVSGAPGTANASWKNDFANVVYGAMHRWGPNILIGGNGRLGYFPNNIHNDINPALVSGIPDLYEQVVSISWNTSSTIIATERQIWQYEDRTGARVWSTVVLFAMNIEKVTVKGGDQPLLWYHVAKEQTHDVYYGSYSGKQKVMQIGLASYTWGTTGYTLPNTTPIVHGVGIKHLEVPPYLRQYQVECELAEGLMLRDGTKVQESVEQQFKELEELCSCSEIVTVVLGLGTSVRGMLGNLQMMTQDEERDLATGRVIKRTLSCTFMVTEVIPYGGEAVPRAVPGSSIPEQLTAYHTSPNGGGGEAEHRGESVSEFGDQRDLVGADSGTVAGPE